MEKAIVTDLAAQLCRHYNLPKEAARYRFGDRTGEESWAERTVLAIRAREALQRRDGIERYLRAVKCWGFGNASLPESALEQRRVVRALLESWADNRAGRAQSAERAKTLANALAIHGVGIARVSKWVFFANPARWAIYDSRVAWALRKLTVDGMRVFPQVPSLGNAQVPGLGADPMRTDRWDVVAAYFNYIAVLNETVKTLRMTTKDASWTPGRVEAGLFMIGEPRTPDRYTRKPLHRGLNAAFLEDDVARPCGW